jgi:hypothetical protein
VPFVVPLGLIEETRRGSGSDLCLEFFNFQRDLVFLIHPFGTHTFPFQHSRALLLLRLDKVIPETGKSMGGGKTFSKMGLLEVASLEIAAVQISNAEMSDDATSNRIKS